jgi:hypothetical protein
MMSAEQSCLSAHAELSFGASRIPCPSATSLSRKTRARSVRWHPSGRNSRRARFRPINTPGLRACGYKTAPGRSNWPNRDPIGEKGGLNLYVFAYNTPVNAFDPDGRFSLIEVAALNTIQANAVMLLPMLVRGILIIVGTGVGGYALCEYGCNRWMRATVLASEREADQITAGDGQHRLVEGGRADALTHCIAGCRLTRNPGVCFTPLRALDRLQAREDRATLPGLSDSINNLVGHTVGNRGKNPTSCASDCVQALNSGELVGIIDGEVRLIPPGEYYAY